MRFNRLDLNLLVALDALLTERSVTKAAQRLSLSPSATSDALARLRDYFEDELLVQVGRRMEPTPRAEALRDAVRDVLIRVDSTIATRPDFNPARSDRAFRIFASDYTQVVLGPQVMRLASEAGSRCRFDFLPQVADPQRDLERGDADLLVLPQTMMASDHPQAPLYTEHFVCVMWQHSALAQQPLTRARFLAAGHLVMRPPSNPHGAFEDSFLQRQQVQRRVAATTYGFTTIPALLVGTEWVATLHARLARQLAPIAPLAIQPCPLAVPPMVQAAQWHRHRSNDPGIVWLKDLFLRAGASLQQTVPH